VIKIQESIHTHEARFSETAGHKLELCKSERKPLIAHHEPKLHRTLVWRVRPRSKRFIILKKRFSHFIQKVYETDPPYLPQVLGRTTHHQLYWPARSHYSHQTQFNSSLIASRGVEYLSRLLPVYVRGHPVHTFLGSPYFSLKTALLM